MILKASQRGSAMELAKHLLKAATNEHVEVHDLRGLVADDLQRALRECEAIARGTRCHKHLFSLSLNPPEHEDVPVEAFEHAIAKIEKELGLENQPRAIVFHEKEGRRHAHVVCSRIDASAMKAIKLPFYRKRLNEIAKQLYLHHGWSLPDGFRNKERSNPLNFTREEWQQALRSKQDLKALKAVFRESWTTSKTKQQFSAKLRERGLYLARGDRRGIVAMDWRGEVYAVGRYAGAKSKDLKERLGEAKDFPPIGEVNTWLSHRIGTKPKSWAGELEVLALKKNLASEFQREQMVQRHRHVCIQLGDIQSLRRKEEDQKRAARAPKGLRGLWGWITGKTHKLRKTNEEEITWARSRDRQEKHGVVKRQLEERRTLQRRINLACKQQQSVINELNRDLADYLRMRGKRMAIRVAELAHAGQTPDWMPGTVPRCVPVETKRNQHGERAMTKVVGVERVSYRGRRRAVEVLACPVMWRPHRQQIAAARQAYEDWWQALDWVREGLLDGGMLRAMEITAAMVKVRPWL